MEGQSKFTTGVIRVVREIPRGQVLSYGQVAVYVGVPRAARQVGWTLRRLEGVDIPWWRVINNRGLITIKGNLYNDANIQRDLLRQEQVEVGEDYTIDIEKYRYLPSKDKLKAWDLDESYLQMVWDKFKRSY